MSAKTPADDKANLLHEAYVIANGLRLPAQLPCTLEEFLTRLGLPPRSVVVEHNQEAVAPSEFPHKTVRTGDKLEIVKIVAGG